MLKNPQIYDFVFGFGLVWATFETECNYVYSPNKVGKHYLPSD